MTDLWAVTRPTGCHLKPRRVPVSGPFSMAPSPGDTSVAANAASGPATLTGSLKRGPSGPPATPDWDRSPALRHPRRSMGAPTAVREGCWAASESRKTQGAVYSRESWGSKMPTGNVQSKLRQ